MNRTPIETTSNSCEPEGIGRKGFAMPSGIVSTFLYALHPLLNVGGGFKSTVAVGGPFIAATQGLSQYWQDAVVEEPAENLVKQPTS
jgi:hypothetical protein